MIAASTSAPEASRIEVKLAASMAVSRSATRHSRELPANASMASTIRHATRKGLCMSVGAYLDAKLFEDRTLLAVADLQTGVVREHCQVQARNGNTAEI